MFAIPFFIPNPYPLVSNFFLVESNESEDNSIFFTYKDEGKSQLVTKCNGEICEMRRITHGDCFLIENSETQETIQISLADTVNIKPAYKKYSLRNGNSYTIGCGTYNDIVVNANNCLFKDIDLTLEVDAEGEIILKGTEYCNSIYVRGRKVQSVSVSLHPFDEFLYMGIPFVVWNGVIAMRDMDVSCSISPLKSVESKKCIDQKVEKNYFIRSPRVLNSLHSDIVEIDGPPNPSNRDKTPAILIMGSSVTMSVVMLSSMGVSITGAFERGNISSIVVNGVTAMGMLMGCLIWPILLWRHQERRVSEEEQNRRKKYHTYISNKEKELSKKNNHFISLLSNKFYPAPSQLCDLLIKDDIRNQLWMRSYEDFDFMYMRLGVGEQPSNVKIVIPKYKFELFDDDLRSKPEDIVKEFSVLSEAPITLDLQNNKTVGVFGEEEVVQDIVNEIILNTVSLHSYDEVKLVLISSERESQKLKPFKNLPHVWSADKRTRYFATTNDEVHYVFGSIDEIVKMRELSDSSQAKGTPLPYFIIIVTDEKLIENEALLRYITNPDNQVGITTLFAYGELSILPKNCRTLIQCEKNNAFIYSKNKNDNEAIPFTPDSISNKHMLDFMSRLTTLNVKVDTRSLSIPERMLFLQMYQVGNVNGLNIGKRWSNNNSDKTLAVPIGVMAGGVPFLLDIHEEYHGCHGLVAGTTGSGKSEFLQAFILSLAVNFSPKEVAFVLVDFKGDDMARPFVKDDEKAPFPHLAATISNLSSNLLYRARVSFNAEIKSRQRLFNEAAASLEVDKLDINSYHRYMKSGRLSDTFPSLPHLVIIVDEFAQLKAQYPEFMSQLINVAQVGRSLGVHLILATQKPSGIVDPQIWSNARFRLCFKVAEKQDSMDMTNRPDSAMIKNPGRCYVQVGYNEVYECVQSAFSGANYIPTEHYLADDDVTVHMTDNTAKSIQSAKKSTNHTNDDEKKQIEAIVAAIIQEGGKKGLTAKKLWEDILPNMILLKDLDKKEKSILTSTVGKLDCIEKQKQESLNIDFDQLGHIAIYGAGGMGKTTFLHTLVYSLICDYHYTPDELHIYVMDFDRGSLKYLNTLPHVGDVVFDSSKEKINNLSKMLRDEIEKRKKIFEDHKNISKESLPSILVIIDNYASFRDEYMDISEEFYDTISSGKTYGIYYVITGNTRNSIHYRVTEHISTYFVLKMNNPDNYFNILNVRPQVVPEDIRGRGITKMGKEVYEFQVAIPYDFDEESDRFTAISNDYEKVKQLWTGNIPMSLLNQNPESRIEEGTDKAYYHKTNHMGMNETLPNAIDEGDPNSLALCSSMSGASVYVSLGMSFRLAVCAEGERDLLEYYQFLIQKIAAGSHSKVFILDDGEMSFKALDGTSEVVKYYSGCDDTDTMLDMLKPEIKKRIDGGNGNGEKIFLLISNYSTVFDMLSDGQANTLRSLVGLLNDAKYEFYFITGFDVNQKKANDRLFMELVVKSENYILCEGSYEKAICEIEDFPRVNRYNERDRYYFHNDQVARVRW